MKRLDLFLLECITSIVSEDDIEKNPILLQHINWERMLVKNFSLSFFQKHFDKSWNLKIMRNNSNLDILEAYPHMNMIPVKDPKYTGFTWNYHNRIEKILMSPRLDSHPDIEKWRLKFRKNNLKEILSSSPDYAMYLSYNELLPLHLLIENPSLNWDWTYLTKISDPIFIFQNPQLNWDYAVFLFYINLTPSLILYHHDLIIKKLPKKNLEYFSNTSYPILCYLSDERDYLIERKAKEFFWNVQAKLCLPPKGKWYLRDFEEYEKLNREHVSLTNE